MLNRSHVLDSLQQMHIIPRDDSPTPPPSPNHPTGPMGAGNPMLQMTPEQVAEMFTMWQRAQAGNQSSESKVKKERSEKRPMSDAEEKPSKKFKVDENGVVDLISDDDEEVEEQDEEQNEGEDEANAATDTPGSNENYSARRRNVMEDSDSDDDCFAANVPGRYRDHWARRRGGVKYTDVDDDQGLFVAQEDY
ncbi:hypothetical protein ONS95_012323 [Cadophora gregata]|uniref:uncharacterized protein n=1 Tax=Cadophora gregata TaxID=51156 RepID=UPI0026DB5564|nr:uncharacterized protein ONS95_012323 [Cadophora gregata]KAK0118012.1 hypothetical protein ONS95_012323 [Cadophora gregata]KAK0123078.1 hypothetical protein ONS96_010086 [Cadophora gregata f. sp. sojae]